MNRLDSVIQCFHDRHFVGRSSARYSTTDEFPSLSIRSSRVDHRRHRLDRVGCGRLAVADRLQAASRGTAINRPDRTVSRGEPIPDRFQTISPATL